MLLVQGTWIQSLVRELDATGHDQKIKNKQKTPNNNKIYSMCLLSLFTVYFLQLRNPAYHMVQKSKVGGKGRYYLYIAMCFRKKTTLLILPKTPLCQCKQ